jgi:hypothetical protein
MIGNWRGFPPLHPLRAARGRKEVGASGLDRFGVNNLFFEGE